MSKSEICYKYIINGICSIIYISYINYHIYNQNNYIKFITINIILIYIYIY
jgi:hypothetical protein